MRNRSALQGVAGSAPRHARIGRSLAALPLGAASRTDTRRLPVRLAAEVRRLCRFRRFRRGRHPGNLSPAPRPVDDIDDADDIDDPRTEDRRPDVREAKRRKRRMPPATESRGGILKKSVGRRERSRRRTRRDRRVRSRRGRGGSGSGRERGGRASRAGASGRGIRARRGFADPPRVGRMPGQERAGRDVREGRFRRP